MRAGWSVGLPNACGQFSGTNMNIPGPPRMMFSPVVDRHSCQSGIERSTGSNANISSSPSST